MDKLDKSKKFSGRNRHACDCEQPGNLALRKLRTKAFGRDSGVHSTDHFSGLGQQIPETGQEGQGAYREKEKRINGKHRKMQILWAAGHVG